MNDTTQQQAETARATADAMQGQAADMAREGQAQFAAAAERTQDAMREMAELARGNADAFAEATRVALEGFQTLSGEWAQFMRAQVEEASNWSKRYAAIKSPTEFVELSREATQAGVDAMVQQSSKSTELALKLANETVAPLSNRMAIALDRLKVAA